MTSASWVVESRGVRILSRDGTVFLQYPEAAVWDLMARGQTLPVVIEKVMLIAGLDRERAQALVDECARKWTVYG